jgi:TPR repeat protein
MLENYPREQLCFIITQYGRSIIDDPRRCRGLLKDLAPNHKRETTLLYLALEEKIVAELVKINTQVPLVIFLERLAHRLHDSVGIQKEFATWAVESWALALGIIQQPLSQQAAIIEPLVHCDELLVEPVDWHGHNYRAAAEQGDAKAQYGLGFSYYLLGYKYEKYYEHAVFWYRKAIEQGHVKAHERLGDMYLYGYGVGKDFEQAVFLYRKAADQGNAAAQYALGVMYYYGSGVELDYEQAVFWWSKAAEQNNNEAQSDLAGMCSIGRGIKKDTMRAHNLASKVNDVMLPGWTDITYSTVFGGDRQINYSTVSRGNIVGKNWAVWYQGGKSATYKINDTLDDGSTVFYVDASGISGLATERRDYGHNELDWKSAMVAGASTYSSYSMWRLPTKDELNMLYQQKDIVGGFTNDVYWSSTEGGSDVAWSQLFLNGSCNIGEKSFTKHVRAVRDF